jgi:hypothetical protein
MSGADDSAEAENLIAAAVDAPEDIRDALDGLVERTATDPGAPFAPDVLGTIEYARKYINAGFRPIPVSYKGKKPTIANWPNVCVGLENLDQFFPGGVDSNIGILLGEASGNLVDVDLDTSAAVALAAHCLPETAMKFGPEGAPSSHFIYRARVDKSRQFEHPETGGTIVELRGNGSQTVSGVCE